MREPPPFDRRSAPSGEAPRIAAAEAEVGSTQSPIDLRDEDITALPKQEVPALKFPYGRRATLDVVNNGSPGEFATIRANVAPGDAELRVGSTTWQLLQFHFHTPASTGWTARRRRWRCTWSIRRPTAASWWWAC